MKNKKELLQYVVLWTLLVAAVFFIWYIGKNSNEIIANTAMAPTASPAATLTPSPKAEVTPSPKVDKEMVGVWIPYMSLTSDNFKENYTQIVESAKKVGATALFVHVRPFSDALYKSKYYPWSHIVTGQQGVAPDFDPLSFMLEETHKNGMEFHAWINPLRVKLKETPKELSADNPYTLLKESNPYYFIETDSGIYLDPSYSYVRELIKNGIKEIVENYDVDGIHFDDYFYPSDMGNQDELSYFAYKDESDVPLSLEDWRKANISAMVSDVYRTVKRTKSDVVFGISPQGNMNNNSKLGADIPEWCAVDGYLDYICPQLYYSYENPALGFTTALGQWQQLEKHDGLKTYIGLALYKVGSDSDGGTWPTDKSIIEKQIADAQSAGTDGVILFDDSSIDELWQ